MKTENVSRVPTGIPGLDPLMKGGFVKDSINLVAGRTGCGKTIFAMQFLIEGIERHGEPGIYITFEERKEKTYAAMLEFGWDLAKYEREGKFIFLEYTPEQVKKVLVEGGGIIEAVIEKVKARRLVIDSVSSFTLLYEDELTKKEASLALFELINKWDCTALLTSQDLSPEEETICASLEFEVDSIIFLYHVKKEGVRHRSMEILKMRGTETPEKTFAFSMTNKGVVTYPSKIVKF